jgi:serine O-acetyltransferase
MTIEAERFGIAPAFGQLRFLWHEMKLRTYGRPLRWLVMFFEPAAGVIISYRVDRCGYLLTGQVWTALRILFFPLFLLLRLWSCPHEITFKAAIGRGLQVLHPTLGVVIHGDAIVGENCILSGGNSIGVRHGIKRGELVLGNSVILGVNACILSPARIGNHVTIGAGAMVISDFADNTVAIGVPARPKNDA